MLGEGCFTVQSVRTEIDFLTILLEVFWSTDEFYSIYQYSIQKVFEIDCGLDLNKSTDAISLSVKRLLNLNFNEKRMKESSIFKERNALRLECMIDKHRKKELYQ